MSYRRVLPVVLGLALAGVPAAAQEPGRLVISSDPVLAELASRLLPDLARRAGMELSEPVRLERRTRADLVRYLTHKLDEELPPAEARNAVEAYALLGLVPEDLDLRAVLLALYTEQVAGFYEPDSTALFVLDDQPREALEGLLVHELVHAVQDQSTDLDALTDPELGNDRSTAAQAAIEGHATLVMFEYLAEQQAGTPVDLAALPGFAELLRSNLDAVRSQFPALASAPRVLQESLIFPYVEGAVFLLGLWGEGERVAPFGSHLPRSTEEILAGPQTPAPVELEVRVTGGEVVHEDVLGRLELGVLLDERVGPGRGVLADGWDGDRYVLVERPGGERALVSIVVWDGVDARDAFADALERRLTGLVEPATLRRADVEGRPATVLTVGPAVGLEARASITAR